jgi:hypothetical protein
MIEGIADVNTTTGPTKKEGAATSPKGPMAAPCVVVLSGIVFGV